MSGNHIPGPEELQAFVIRLKSYSIEIQVPIPLQRVELRSGDQRLELIGLRILASG